jgi:hypothetical protein
VLRIEPDDFLIGEVRENLEQNATIVFELYQSKQVEAKLFELGKQGITIEVYWKKYQQTEFISLDRREADELETFVWAFADFEWVVINNDERQQLQRSLDELNEIEAV